MTGLPLVARPLLVEELDKEASPFRREILLALDTDDDGIMLMVTIKDDANVCVVVTTEQDVNQDPFRNFGAKIQS